MRHKAVGDILSKCSEFGWKAVEEECCQYLPERLAGSPEEAERKFQIASAVDGKEQFHAGNEHYIFLPSDDNQNRVVKWTYGNNFGLKLNVYENDPAGMNQNVIPTGNVDPIYYLKRWIILNTISSPITRLEGLLPPDFRSGERLPRLSISQDMLPPENPTYQEIFRAFRRVGFNIAENSYYRIGDNVLLGEQPRGTSASWTSGSSPAMRLPKTRRVRRAVGVGRKLRVKVDPWHLPLPIPRVQPARTKYWRKGLV